MCKRCARQARRAYSTYAFVLKGQSHIQPNNRTPIWGRNIFNDPRNGCFFPIELDVPTSIIELDCVGTIVGVKSDIYKNVKHINHPAYTDWFSIAEECRRLGRKVIGDRSIVATHANLGDWKKYPGEGWH